jgi:hypothetical protein
MNSIEFIYESTKSLEYQNFSRLYFLPDEEKLKYPLKHLIPVNIKNNSFCGGGNLYYNI